MHLDLPVGNKTDQIFELDRNLRDFVVRYLGQDLDADALEVLDNLARDADDLVPAFSGFDPGAEVCASLESIQGALDTISSFSAEAEAVVEGTCFEPAEVEMEPRGVEPPAPV